MVQRSTQIDDKKWLTAGELIHPAKFNQISDLLASKELFFKAFNFLPGTMLVSTVEGIFIEINEGFLELTGYSREEVLGVNAIDLVWKKRKDRAKFVRSLKVAGAVKNLEFPFRKKNGETFIGALSAVKVDIDSETFILSSINDITSHIEAQAVLQKYSALFRGVMDIILITDLKGRIIEANDRALEVYGYTRSELLQLNAQDIRAVDDRKIVMQKLMEANEKGSIYETWHKSKEGKLFPVEISLKGVSVRKQRYLMGVIRDITERKQTEERLRRDAEEIMDLYNNAPCGYHSLDEDGCYLRINDTELSWLGFTREEVLGRKLSDFLSPESARRFLKGYPGFKKRSEVKNVEFDFIRRDGKILPVLLNSTAVKDAQGKFVMSRAIMINIEERRMAEEIRRKDAQEIFDLYNQAPCGYESVDEKGVFIRINDTLARWLGVQPDEVIGKKSLGDYLTPEYSAQFNKNFPIFKEQGSIKSQEVELLRADGSILTALLNAEAVKDESGRYIMSRASLIDISERKKMEEAVLQSEKKYRSIFENAQEGLYQTSPNKKYISVNPACASMFGYDSPQEMIAAVNDSYDTFVNVEEAYKMRDEIIKQGFIRDYIIERIKKDGTTFWTSINASIIYDKEGKIKFVEGSYVDVSEKIRYQKEVEYINEHDPLTGLYNRKYFEKVLNSTEAKKINGIIMCDIDGLKLVNDSIGHWAGDDLLVAASEVIKSCFYTDEVIARMGGDEFAVLMSGADWGILNDATQQIRLGVDVYNAKGPLIPLSITAGVAYREDSASDFYDLMKMADDNMCRQKLRSSQSARSAIVRTLTKTMEERDFGTQNHADRLIELMSEFVLRIDFPAWKREELVLFSQFHDIGKVGIPDRILFKPGSLNPEEKLEMQKHSEIGYRIAQSSPDLAGISELILKHHEWWNGEGYPLGLKGEEIPVGCRMLSIVDAYDAMTSDRPYRKAMSHDQALEELLSCKGRQFDPQLVDIFLEFIAPFVGS